MQVPSNLVLNKIGKPAIYLPCCMVIWGTISCLTGITTNFGGLLACRFFLGFVEAVYFVSGCSKLDACHSSDLARMSVLFELLVYPQRTWTSNSSLILWIFDQWCFFGTYCRRNNGSHVRFSSHMNLPDDIHKEMKRRLPALEDSVFIGDPLLLSQVS